MALLIFIRGEINEQDFAELLFGLGLRPPAIVYEPWLQ